MREIKYKEMTCQLAKNLSQNLKKKCPKFDKRQLCLQPCNYYTPTEGFGCQMSFTNKYITLLDTEAVQLLSAARRTSCIKKI